jgi:hypothetical protein
MVAALGGARPSSYWLIPLLLLPALAAVEQFCPLPPSQYVRMTGVCTSTSGCTDLHCNCGPSKSLSEGVCSTVAECVQQATANCSADPHCQSFDVRSDCATGPTTAGKRWITHPDGCNDTVPNSQWIVYSRLGGGPCPPSPAPPPPPVKNIGLLPKWKPTWNMSRSTMLYTCNHSGFHDANYAARFGVVSYDWSNDKAEWAQAKPMNCEEMLTKQADKVLAIDAGIENEQPKVWIYRNTIKALNWFTSVREKLDDPAYAGWFVPFANYSGPRSNGSYHVPACTFEKCSGFCERLYRPRPSMPAHTCSCCRLEKAEPPFDSCLTPASICAL